MYRAGEVSVHRTCCERATQPYSLGGGGTIYPGSRPAGVTTHCPRMVTVCLLTRSMLIKMYKLTISGYVPAGGQYQQVVTTRSPRIVTECLLTRLMLFKMCVYAIYSRFRIGTILSVRKHGYEYITTLPYRV